MVYVRLTELSGEVKYFYNDAEVSPYINTILNSSLHWCSTKYDDAGNVSSIHICAKLKGGKGGFGSNLRAQGNKMSSKKRSGNYSACRDISGNRIRQLDQAKRISLYLKNDKKLEYDKKLAIERKMDNILNSFHLSNTGKNSSLPLVCSNVDNEIEFDILKNISKNSNTVNKCE